MTRTTNMMAVLTAILSGVFAFGVSPALAQQNPAPTQSVTAGRPSENPRIAPGSVIPVVLSRIIDAKKVKVGDEVEAKVTQDLKAEGEIIIPKDTKVFGHVTQAETRNKERKESQVGIAFDHAVTKSGDNLPLSMSIQAIIAPPGQNADSGVGSPGQPTSAQAPPSGRSNGMGGGAVSPPTSPSGNADSSTGGPVPGNARPPITGETQGVIGISNLNLSAAPDATQGSIVSSGKGNVKLDSGTLMLLRVNQ
jgi:hypothetical protein